MKIVVIGTRGIPDILGGVETHCEQLYPRIAAMGHDVTVIRRTPYVSASPGLKSFRGVKLIDVFAPRRKSVEAIVHTFLAVIRARRLNPDVLHVHAIGPAIMVPFARLLGMKVVMTNHGPDYDRQKWGRLAKFVLRTGERFGTRFANRVIVISKVIAGILASSYGRTDSTLIYNGVEKPVKSTRRDFMEKWGLNDRPYIVAIGRFVKEKGFHDLIEAYLKSGLNDRYALAIAGDSDHPDQYSESLKKQAREAGVVLTGFIKGEALNQLMTNASLFVMPSYHEGLPIALLEAMSYDLPVVVSDIPANRLDTLSPENFFTTGDTDSLAQAMCSRLTDDNPASYDLTPYNWDTIARRTADLYASLVNK
ncbi:MAG: glycosyltransferase family 4 protein [Muribaculaceae bacterium]|nr:glycosyltransferase family 4 protein [Muribaculaceae bacterium]